MGTTTADVDIIRRNSLGLGSSPAEGEAGDPSPVTSRACSPRPGPSPTSCGETAISPVAGSPSRVGKVGAAFVQLVERVPRSSWPTRTRAVTNVETYGVKGVDVEDIHTVDCDFYSPCALGGGLNETTIPGLNCQAIVGSANNQLATEDDADRIAARGIVYAPDFVVNAGGLINVHDELHGYSKMRAMHRVDSIFGDQSHPPRIEEQQVNPNQAAVLLAEDRIREIGDLRRFRRSGEDLN